MLRDARVLQPEFVPNDVVHRASEVDTLTNALDPVSEGNRGETTFLHGPSGSGKTCIAQYTLEELREAVLDIETQYVNCWDHHTSFKTLYQLLAGLDRTVDVHRRSTPTDELLDRLKAYSGPPYVAILDEVDQLEDTGVLYELNRLDDLTLVLIANDEAALFDTLDDRLYSRLKTTIRIHFDPYTVDELVAILKDRVRWGLHPDAITTTQLEWIADATAGDARVAIETLRVAARQATTDGHDTITDTILEDALPTAEAELHARNLDRLTTHQRVLYDIITDHETITPGTLYEAYRQRVDDPKSDRTVRNYLRKLARYDLIHADGHNRGRTYHARTP